MLDVRTSDQFGTGHVPGSWNIGLSGQFASWAGTLLKLQTPLIIVSSDDEHVREARVRLARVGHENVAGYLEGGILAWHQAGLPLATTEQISVDELDRRIKEGTAEQVLDVRRPPEWQSGHIQQAIHHPLNHLQETAEKLNKDAATAIICAGGFRSSIASSIL